MDGRSRPAIPALALCTVFFDIARYAALITAVSEVCDSYHLKSHKYVCITTYQPDTKSNPNPNPTIKQHAIVNIQLNIVTAYPDKF